MHQFSLAPGAEHHRTLVSQHRYKGVLGHLQPTQCTTATPYMLHTRLLTGKRSSTTAALDRLQSRLPMYRRRQKLPLCTGRAAGAKSCRKTLPLPTPACIHEVSSIWPAPSLERTECSKAYNRQIMPALSSSAKAEPTCRKPAQEQMSRMNGGKKITVAVSVTGLMPGKCRLKDGIHGRKPAPVGYSPSAPGNTTTHYCLCKSILTCRRLGHQAKAQPFVATQ